MCSLTLCRRSHRWFPVRFILYKGTFARSPQCSRRRCIDEAGNNTRIAIDQCAANCLEEAVLSFAAMCSRCLSSSADVTLRRSLPVLQVALCSSLHCSQTPITVELYHCTRAPIARLENPSSWKPKILFSFKLCKLLEFFFLPSWRHT